MPARFIAAAAVVALLAGCGGGGKRSAVAQYIGRVNAVQAALKTQLAAAAKANAGFSTRPAALAGLRPRLVASERTFRTLRRRLARLEPPPEASRLHDLLLRLVGGEAELAHELVQLADFLPRIDRALGLVGQANARLQRTLAGTPTPSAEATALDRYRSDLAAPLARLRALAPPPVMAPALRAELTTLARVRAAAAPLAQALRQKRRAALPALVKRFDAAAKAGASLSERRAQADAVKAYDARVSALGDLSGKVERERARLERTLG